MAVGDALGLGAEFMTRREVKTLYPDGLTNYDMFVRDAHRAQWQRGEWSNDMEIPLVIVENIVREDRFDMDVVRDALQQWFESDPRDMVNCMRWLRNHNKEWYVNPYDVCREIWQKINHFEASNEALCRGLLVAVLSDNVLEDTRNIVLLTHCHKRCVGTACIIAKVGRELFINDRDADYEELKWIASQTDAKILPYLEIARKGSLEELDLDDEDTLWYTRKTMAAALWTLWHCSSAEEALHLLIDMGGDADTNASLACGLMGLKHGEDGLPKYLVDGLKERKRLDAAIESLADYEERHYAAPQNE